MVTEAHGTALNNTLGGITPNSGMKIQTGSTAITLTKVTKGSTCTALYVRLYSESGGGLGSQLNAQTFSGDDATFNYSLSANTYYFLVVDSDGSTYTKSYSSTAPFDGGGTIAGTYITWVDGWHNNQVIVGEAINIVSIDVSPPSINMQINIGDAWKTVPAAQINIGDAWKAVASAKINIGDVWKTVF